MNPFPMISAVTPDALVAGIIGGREIVMLIIFFHGSVRGWHTGMVQSHRFDSVTGHCVHAPSPKLPNPQKILALKGYIDS
jgi:hypothetical protein